MKQTKLLFLFSLSFVINVCAQNVKVADKYFKEFAYVKAAKLYEAIYEKGDSTSYILKRLGDSYYNNVETVKAEYWYSKLINNHDEIDDDYLFKYAQVLRSNNNYKKSDSLLLAISSRNKQDDVQEDIKNQKYLIDFSESNNKRLSVRNLAINTEYSDFGGVMYDEKVYFASSSPRSLKKEKLYKWNNQPFLNIYKSYDYVKPMEESEKDSVLELQDKSILPSPVNTQYHESTPIFTKDGNTMYFTRVNYDGKKLGKDKKQVINLKIYKAKKVGSHWDNITELPFNSDEYSVGHPALSPDEKFIYFVSDMPGGVGKTDIYKASISESEEYGKPINLGEKVNTKGKEMFPFIGADSTFYFSSNGHVGLGLLDIFQTKIENDTIKADPVNLGFPFNSKRDDFSFYVNEKGNKGFFSSNREKGKGDDDIYSFIIYEEEIPEVCNEMISGIVRSKHDNSPIPYATVKLVDNNGELLGEVLSKEDGSYAFEEIPCIVESFVVHGSKQDFKPDRKDAKTTGVKDNNTKADLVLTPLIIGNQIVISPIYFDFNKDNIRPDAQVELENIVSVMSNHPNMVIKIESHTDSRGSKAYNRNLSDRRAKSTRDYLFSRGIARDRIESAIGYGEDQLLNHCDDAHIKKCTEEEHQLNRRSYFYIVKGGSDVDILNKKPEVIDNSLEVYKAKMADKMAKRKALYERLNRFRKGRAKKQHKCLKDTDCN